MGKPTWLSTVLALSVVSAAGLGVDAFVHLHLASSYALVRTEFVSQATLFRVEGIAAAASALFLLAHPSRPAALTAVVISGAGVAAVFGYTYVDVGQLGPLPDMFEPVWYPEKLSSCVAEATAALAGGTLLGLLAHHSPRQTAESGRRQEN